MLNFAKRQATWAVPRSHDNGEYPNAASVQSPKCADAKFTKNQLAHFDIVLLHLIYASNITLEINANDRARASAIALASDE